MEDSKIVQRYKAWQIFDGLMLGDAGLTRQGNGCFFSINLSDTKKLKTRGRITPEQFCSYLVGIKEHLQHLGIEFSTLFPKTYVSESHSKPYVSACLKSLNSPYLLESYPKWYIGGEWHRVGYHKCFTGAEKVVREDLELTTLSLAYWFMCDGSANPVRHLYDEVDPRFHTEGFCESSVGYLKSQLHKLGIEAELYHQSCRGVMYPYLDIRKDSTNTFMGLIDPYVVEPYRYKIQYVPR